MPFYKVLGIKDTQRVTLAIQSDSLESAKHEVHKQGYSILEISQIDQIDKSGDIFYFDARIQGQLKEKQKIQSNDILKAYVKLKDDLKYEVLAIYTEENASDRDKLLTTNKVRESYTLFLNEKTKNESSDEATPEVKAVGIDVNLSENSVLEKDIQRNIATINKVITKIENLLTNYSDHFTQEKQKTLHELFITLKQIRNITNVTKIQSVGEKALLKISEIEIELINDDIFQEKQDILGETNQLLKEFGSSKKVSLNQTNPFLDEVKLFVIEFFRDFLKGKKKEVNNEKGSITYYKSLRELQIYRKKLKEINTLLFHSYIRFESKNRKLLHIKKRLIQQNIRLIENRFQGKRFSYNKIIKGTSFYIDKLKNFIRFIGEQLIYGIFIFAFLYLLSITFFLLFGLENTINPSFLFFFVLISFFSFFSRFLVNNFLFFLFSLFYSFVFIFLFVNI